jgi:carbon-monoxide dehydrogenase large subunit
MMEPRTESGEPGTGAGRRWIGRALKRVEDPRVLAGHGTFVGDMRLPRMLEVAFVRSPHAHARILRVDPEPARQHRGVAAVLTGAEAARHVTPWRGVLLHYQGMKTGPQYPLAWDRVRYVGEPVAAVAAASRAQAEDACELLRVEYEPLPPLLDAEAALRPGAPHLHDDLEDNRILHAEFRGGDVEAAFGEAAHVFRDTFHFSRHTGVTIEPRSLLAQFEPATRSLTLWISTQVPHMMQAVLAAILSLEEHRIRVIAPDVGGSFGIKIHVYQDDIAACLLSILTGRPVKWVADRRESFLADIHAREQRVAIELATRADGTILGLKAEVMAPVGAWSAYPRSSVVEGSQTVRLLPGPYRVRSYVYTLDVVAQNKVITSQYRAVGHPIAAACMDGILDLAARGLGLDPAEVRLRNLLRCPEFPYTSITGNLYDSGSYAECLEMLLERTGYVALRREQAVLRDRGVHRGIGLCCFIEITGPGAQFYGMGGAPISGQDGTTVRVEPSGKITALIGVTDQGQGTHTTMAQIVAEHLGVDVQDVKVISGDTGATPYGGGTWASRSSVVGAGAAILASQAVREKILGVGAHLLEANREDLELAEGKVFVRGSPGRALPLAEVARTVHFQSHKLPKELEPSLEATNHYTNPIAWTFTNGAHLALVEVDVETGEVRLLQYAVVEDCGRLINPAIVDGQVRGGVAQGIGGALYEECVYDGTGQLLTTSLADYLVPTTAEVPDIQVDHLETPSPFTVGGFKGVGEAGTAGAPGAILNAVNDALLPFGARITRQPITPERILLALRLARTS